MFYFDIIQISFIFEDKLKGLKGTYYQFWF